MNQNKKFQIRTAEREDMKHVSNMIQFYRPNKELAVFEEMPSGPKIKTKELIQDGFDSNVPFFFCLIAENDEKEALGYAIFYYTYSTWLGKAMFLEDLYVRPQHRKFGVGKALFEKVLEVSKEKGCKRLDFVVLSWNPATKFYQKLGCQDITTKDKWHFYRMVF